jgi:hypothetical protein
MKDSVIYEEIVQSVTNDLIALARDVHLTKITTMSALVMRERIIKEMQQYRDEPHSRIA